MTMRQLFTPIGIAAAMMLTACGDGSGVSSRVKDHKAYSLGQEHGVMAVSLKDDEPAMQDFLLDVRARITNINTNIGAQAAADYERGFIDGVSQADDSLARVLF